MESRHTRTGINKGQELVEFALVLPLLLLIAFGVLDLGRAFHAAITIENAARVGARYGARNAGEDTDIRTATCNEAQSSGITLVCDSAHVVIAYPGGAVPGEPVIVTVKYDFELIIGSVLPYKNATLQGSAEMLIP